MRESEMPQIKRVPKLDEKGKAIEGRFVGVAVVKPYTLRILRGAIELPHERTVRAKAEAKRERKRQARVSNV